MIERYSREEIRNIWNEKNKYQIWLDIEIASAQAMERLKLIPKGISAKVKRKATINVDRIHKIENKVNHDVIAFLSSISENGGIQYYLLILQALKNLKDWPKLLALRSSSAQARSVLRRVVKRLGPRLGRAAR